MKKTLSNDGFCGNGRCETFLENTRKIKNTQDGQKSVLEDLPSDERGGKNQRHHLHVGKRSVGVIVSYFTAA